MVSGMTSPADGAPPDYDRVASVFDRYLPLVEPVGSAILARLPTLPARAHVLDVACGTGEPGLTLARRSPGVRVPLPPGSSTFRARRRRAKASPTFALRS
jgi:SAM-dependent methyltransferase